MIRAGPLLFALLPILLLGGLVWSVLGGGRTLLGTSPVPPEALLRLRIEGIVLRPGRIVATVRNIGPAEAVIAGVAVNEALWEFEASPGPEVPRLGRVDVIVPYPWDEGDPLRLALVTSNGLVFRREVAVATRTPLPDARAAWQFGLLGLYVGVIPVFLGLSAVPYLLGLGARWLDVLISVTVGLLVFLAVDALTEAFAVARRLEGPLNGAALIVAGVAGSYLGLAACGRAMTRAGRGGSRAGPTLAYLVATGIGLHNMGEGLALGTAYAAGELALGASLVLGFMLHNTTEGLALAGPVIDRRPSLRQLAGLGLVAGAPTVAGTWIGGFTYSEPWWLVFLAVGAGAILQVVVEITRARAGQDGVAALLARPRTLLGLLAGYLVMCATGLLIPR